MKSSRETSSRLALCTYLVKGREKLAEVLLCSVWSRSELTTGHLATPQGMEDARRGNLPGFHVLAECGLAGPPREVRFVDFRRACSLPVAFLRKKSLLDGRRLRLLPPYREHLAKLEATNQRGRTWAVRQS